MYKIGNQFIILKEVFAVSEPVIRDGCTMYAYIYSTGGAKVEVLFKSLESDNCKADGYCAQTFIDRTNNLVYQLEKLITQIEYRP